MSEQLEGRHAVAEALNAGVPLEKVLLAAGIEDDEAIARILVSCRKQGIKVERVKRSALDRMSQTRGGAHQGVIALARTYGYSSLREILDAAQGSSSALVIVLDHVQDSGNLGAIIRTADVVGAAGVVIPNRRAAQVTTGAYKSSAGAVSHVKVARESNLVSVLEELKFAGFWVVGSSEHAEDVLWDASFEGRIALVMGSEDRGISRLVLENCDMLAKLPQAGHVESLNVAQATTAMAYEWLRCNRGVLDGVGE